MSDDQRRDRRANPIDSDNERDESGDKDSLHAFDFEQFPVRGKLVHLNASWRAVRERKEYPDVVSKLLGQALAASVLLGSTLKFDGKLTLQMQSDGPVTLLLSQSSSQNHVRGLAHFDGERLADLQAPRQSSAKSQEFSELMQNGRLALTLEPDGKGKRYQGIVPLESDSFAACIEAYFDASEQLPTRLWFAANQRRVVGMLLQQMPSDGGAQTKNQDPDAWDRIQILADTITEEELLQLSDKEILRRLFHEEDIRLFDSKPVSFKCRCSDENIRSMLRGLGREEVREVIQEQGAIKVDCEFCGRHYTLDSVDAEQLFVDSPSPTSPKKH